MPRWLDGGDEIARSWRAEDTFCTQSHIIHLPSLIAGSDRYSVQSTPAYFNGVAADYDFVPHSPPPVRWLQFLGELFGDDVESMELLRQWFGYCLTADTRQQKIMLMVGPKRSGKGTIARVMRSLVGEGNCCAPTLSGLATNFGLQALIGKTMAIIGDARLSGKTDVAATTERLLSISGEDAQTIDRKHKEPITTQLRTRFTVISNELPRLNDASGALAGRLVILRFVKSFFGQEDKSLSDALHAERQSILLWAIGGWASLRQAGRFIEPQSSSDLVDQMADIASPITAFVGDRCDLSPNSETPLPTLYASFRSWSESNGIDKPVSQPVFSRDLTAAYPDLNRVRTRDASGTGPGTENRMTKIRGIRLGG
jgi:putative DNA primase/helicase